MRKALSLVLVGLMVLSMLSVFPSQVKAQQTILFSDDFESYTVETLPSPPWEFWFNNIGEIVDTTYVSPTKSLRLLGSYGWSTEAIRRFSSNSRYIGYEVYGNVESVAGPFSLTVGFAKRTSATTSNWYASVSFQIKDGQAVIVASGTILQKYVANKWYKIRVIFDRDDRTYDVWIDDILRGTALPEGRTDVYEIEGFNVASEWAEVNCYFDDVKVFEGERLPLERPVAVLSVSSTKSDTGRPLIFDASSSYDPDGSIAYYFFDYGDGSTSGWITQPTSLKYYTTAGEYCAKVKVKDNDGLESDWSSEVKVTIANPPPPMQIFERKFYGKKEGWRWPWEPEIVAITDAKLAPGQSTTLQIEFANPPTSHTYIYISEQNLKSLIISDPHGVIDKSKVYLKKYTETPYSDVVAKIQELSEFGEVVSHLIFGEIPYEFFVAKISREIIGEIPTSPPSLVAMIADALRDKYNQIGAALLNFSIGYEYGEQNGILLPPSSSIVFSLDITAPDSEVTTQISIKFDCQYIQTPYSGLESDLPYIWRNIYLEELEGNRPLSKITTFSSPSRASATLELDIKEERPWWEHILRFIGGSPINIQVIDPLGRKIGFNPATNSNIIEIPNATYSGAYSQPQMITIPNPIVGTYVIKIYGYSEGSYRIGIDIQNRSGELVSSFEKTGKIDRAEKREIWVQLESSGKVNELVMPWWIQHQLWIIALVIGVIALISIAIILTRRRKEP